MDNRCVPRQVLPSNPKYEGYAVWSFAIWSIINILSVDSVDLSFSVLQKETF